MIKRLTSILFILILIYSCKHKIEANSESFILNATLTNIPDSTLFYLKDNASNTLDSTYAINGNISLKTNINSKGPEDLILLSTSPDFLYLKLLVGNDQITFNADKSDFPWNIDAAGSKYQDNVEVYHNIEFQRQQLSAKLRQKYSSDKELLSQKLQKMSDSLDREIVKHIKSNFNTYAALNYFKYHKNSFSVQELSNLWNQLDDELKETVMGKAVKLQSEFPQPNVGDQYYDYSAINQNGDTISLSKIKDKYILLHFSSSACYGSQLSLPELKELQTKFSSDLEIISISTDIDKKNWLNHIKRDSISWHYLWDGKGSYNDANIKYWEIGTPNYVLISPEKTILERWYGYGNGLIKKHVVKHLDK